MKRLFQSNSKAPVLTLSGSMSTVNTETQGSLRSVAKSLADLALGARGVLVGRAPLWGLASDGEAGATLALDILREELERVMAFTGVPNVSAYNPQLLHALAD